MSSIPRTQSTTEINVNDSSHNRTKILTWEIKWALFPEFSPLPNPTPTIPATTQFTTELKNNSRQSLRKGFHLLPIKNPNRRDKIGKIEVHNGIWGVVGWFGWSKVWYLDFPRENGHCLEQLSQNKPAWQRRNKNLHIVACGYYVFVWNEIEKKPKTNEMNINMWTFHKLNILEKKYDRIT